jgi:DNA repair ATPase RecN
LGQTLNQRDKIDGVLRDVPLRTARLAESLPKLTGDLTKLLRETKHLKSVAEALAQIRESLDAAADKWPGVKLALEHTAKILKASADRLDHIVKNRAEYEASVKQSTELAETFSRAVPLITDQVSIQLAEQEKSLRDLELSLDEAGETIPAFRQSSLDVLRAGRLLLAIVTIAIALHGLFLLVDNWRMRKTA